MGFYKKYIDLYRDDFNQNQLAILKDKEYFCSFAVKKMDLILNEMENISNTMQKKSLLSNFLKECIKSYESCDTNMLMLGSSKKNISNFLDSIAFPEKLDMQTKSFDRNNTPLMQSISYMVAY